MKKSFLQSNFTTSTKHTSYPKKTQVLTRYIRSLNKNINKHDIATCGKSSHHSQLHKTIKLKPSP